MSETTPSYDAVARSTRAKQRNSAWVPVRISVSVTGEGEVEPVVAAVVLQLALALRDGHPLDVDRVAAMVAEVADQHRQVTDGE